MANDEHVAMLKKGVAAGLRRQMFRRISDAVATSREAHRPPRSAPNPEHCGMSVL
jgi:hypothetical protein